MLKRSTAVRKRQKQQKEKKHNEKLQLYYNNNYRNSLFIVNPTVLL